MGYKIYAPKPMSDESMEMLRKKGFEIIGEWQDSREDMKKYMAEADVVIARVHFFDDELLALAKNLKLIQVHGVGYQDHVVCEDAAKRGIYVAYSPYGNHFTVAEGAVALTLAMTSTSASTTPRCVPPRASRPRWPLSFPALPLAYWVWATLPAAMPRRCSTA